MRPDRARLRRADPEQVIGMPVRNGDWKVIYPLQK